jgi:hypothetical protein
MSTKRQGHWPSNLPIQRKSPRLVAKREENPDPEIIIWICDSLPRYLDFCGEEQRNRFQPRLNWPFRTVPPHKKWMIFSLAHVSILLVTFGGWDPEMHLIPPEMLTDIQELLNGRPKTMVKQVWVSGGINHLRGHCFPNTPQDSENRAGNLAVALGTVFRAMADTFPNAALRFLGVGRMPIGRDVGRSTIAESSEMNRAAAIVLDLMDTALDEMVQTASPQQFYSRGGHGFACVCDIFRNWDDDMTDDEHGHPNDRGHAHMVRNLFMGPGCTCLTHRQFTFLG